MSVSAGAEVQPKVGVVLEYLVRSFLGVDGGSSCANCWQAYWMGRPLNTKREAATYLSATISTIISVSRAADCLLLR